MIAPTRSTSPYANFTSAVDLHAARIDPRSVQFERDRDGAPCARTRRDDGAQIVFRASPEDPTRWAAVDPGTDGSLRLARTLDTSVGSLLASHLDHIDRTVVIAYRPSRRIVVAVHGRRDGHARTFYVKGLRRSAARRLAGPIEALEGTSASTHLALPIDSRPDLGAFLFEDAAGHSLHDAGRRRVETQTGGVVALLDSFTLHRDDTLPLRTWEDERRSALTLLARAIEHVTAVDRLIDLVGALDAPEDDGDLALVHGDLHDKQIRLGSMQVIDCDTVGRGSPWIDRVNLLEHVDLRVRQGLWSEAWASPWRKALAVPSTPTTTSLRTLVRARLTAVYALRPAWSAVAAELLSLTLDRRSP